MGDHEKFLLEVTNNRFFRQICGGHSGFGYTFENIILSSLIVRGALVLESNFPYRIPDISYVQRLEGQIRYGEYEFQENIVYHTPNTRGVDAILLDNNEIIAIQITTQHSGNQSKLEALLNEVKKIQSELQIPVKGWFVSLFKVDLDTPDEIMLTHGSELEVLIGKSVYDEIVEMKTNL